MSKREVNTLVVGLDIGTHRVTAMVGEVNADGGIKVTGVGRHPSRGMKKGVVVNIESTIQAIQHAVLAAEQMADCQVHSIHTGIGGSHIRGINSNGVIPIASREVTAADVENVLQTAQAVAIPADQKILHVLPQEYVIDGLEGVRKPIAMAGVRLEARVHIVTCAESAAQNLIKCIAHCKLSVDEIVLQPIAAARAVLSEDEKELGVCLIDIGAGTTDIVVFINGFVSHTAVIPIAGDQVTNDIAVVQRISTQLAEKIKVEQGCCLTQLVRADEMVEVPTVGHHSKRLSRQALTQVIESRYEELFCLVQEELRRSGYEQLIGAGIVLTGGSSEILGAVDLAEEVFHMPVRIGVPTNVEGSREVLESPSYATAVGLLMESRENDGRQHIKNERTRLGMFARFKKQFFNDLVSKF